MTTATPAGTLWVTVTATHQPEAGTAIAATNQTQAQVDAVLEGQPELLARPFRYAIFDSARVLYPQPYDSHTLTLARKAQLRSMGEVARAMGVHPLVLHRLENGVVHSIPETALDALAYEYGLPPALVEYCASTRDGHSRINAPALRPEAWDTWVSRTATPGQGLI